MLRGQLFFYYATRTINVSTQYFIPEVAFGGNTRVTTEGSSSFIISVWICMQKNLFLNARTVI